MSSTKVLRVRPLLSVLIILAVLLTGCQAAATPTAAPVEPTAVVAPTTAPEATTAPEVTGPKYQEAPMLTDLVAKGELPPVEERLPEEPAGSAGNREHRRIWWNLAPWFPRTIGLQQLRPRRL